MSIKPTESESKEVQLFREIDALNSQVAELQDYLVNLRIQPTFNAAPNPMTPTEIIKKAQETVRQQQEAAAKLAEARAIEQSLIALEGQLSEKRGQLKALKDKENFDKLVAFSREFNATIDRSSELLEQMRKANLELGQGGLEVRADLMELPYASIRSNEVIVRRRYDVLRERS